MAGGRDAPADHCALRPGSESPVPASRSLERVLERQLNDPAVFRHRDAAKWRGAEGATRVAESGLVPHVERLDPSLHAVVAEEVEVLEDRQVRALEAGPADGVAAGVARAHARVGEGTRHEAAGIEPLINPAGN